MDRQSQRQRRPDEAWLASDRTTITPAPPEELAEATRRTQPTVASDDTPAPGDAHMVRRALLDRLASRRALRQAIMLKEILAPPKALQHREHS